MEPVNYRTLLEQDTDIDAEVCAVVPRDEFEHADLHDCLDFCPPNTHAQRSTMLALPATAYQECFYRRKAQFDL